MKWRGRAFCRSGKRPKRPKDEKKRETSTKRRENSFHSMDSYEQKICINEAKRKCFTNLPFQKSRKHPVSRQLFQHTPGKARPGKGRKSWENDEKTSLFPRKRGK
jgi:hypothetical protein